MPSDGKSSHSLWQGELTTQYQKVTSEISAYLNI